MRPWFHISADKGAVVAGPNVRPDFNPTSGVLLGIGGGYPMNESDQLDNVTTSGTSDTTASFITLLQWLPIEYIGGGSCVYDLTSGVQNEYCASAIR